MAPQFTICVETTHCKKILPLLCLALLCQTLLCQASAIWAAPPEKHGSVLFDVDKMQYMESSTKYPVSKAKMRMVRFCISNSACLSCLKTMDELLANEPAIFKYRITEAKPPIVEFVYDAKQLNLKQFFNHIQQRDFLFTKVKVERFSQAKW
jgi:hypothetical protein